MPEHHEALCGGIDLGGTKIEAALFDSLFQPIVRRRMTTPVNSYEALRDALVCEVAWLRDLANQPELRIGIGLPGLVDPVSGISVTSNLPANGHTLAQDLGDISGGKIVAANDCKTFALSEANGGAGKDHSRVFGLIIGTGLGGGLCRDGVLDLGANGLVGEVGHYGLPAHLVAEFNLPILRCGCGRSGCYEIFVSGRGITRLAQEVARVDLGGREISQRALSGDPNMVLVLDIWMRLAAELIHTIQLHLDPDCIVLGGGLSQIEDLPEMLNQKLSKVLLPSVHAPKILKPRFGDSSGGRGAALLAMQHHGDEIQ